MKQMNQLYTLALALLMATTFQACDNNELTPADVKPEGKVPLKVGLNIDGWGGDASGTRAEGDKVVAANLLDGGEIAVQIIEYEENGTDLNFPTMQCNFFTVKNGKLERLPYNKEDDNQTEADIAIRKSGDYYVYSGGNARLMSDGVAYDAYILYNETGTYDQIGRKTPIKIVNGAVSLDLSCTIASAGLRLIAMNADGSPYNGAEEIEATPKNVSIYYEDPSIPFGSQTLNVDKGTVIWGNLATNNIAAGAQLLQLKVGEKIYKVNAPRNINFEPSYLYTFNVRVGATSIIVSSDALGIDDFVVQGTTNAEALPLS